jgi:endonuclease/exonuclease/phosphatase family metal-dependent hydrolase
VSPALRIVAYNFLAGGSARRVGQWSRVLRSLEPDVVLAQECRPPSECHDERFRPGADDTFHWRPARARSRWGTAVLVRGAALTPIAVPQFDGWVVGGEIRNARWSSRPVCVFSVHGPAGERGFVRTMHEIIDRVMRLMRSRGDADLILGGDFNVAVGRRLENDPRRLGRGERDLLDRLDDELDLIACWQTANPNRRLAQTLRWSGNPKVPYHCDGIFVPRAWAPRLTGCRVVCGSRWKMLSDHNPVLALFASATISRRASSAVAMGLENASRTGRGPLLVTADISKP